MPERLEAPDAQARIDGYRRRALQLLEKAQMLHDAGPRSTVLMTAQDLFAHGRRTGEDLARAIAIEAR